MMDQPIECNETALLTAALVKLGVAAQSLQGPHCDWFGIACNSNGCVSEINLREESLDGEVSSELGSLLWLESLDLNKNPRLHGKLSELRNLERLVALDLSQTQVAGSLEDVESMKLLQELYLWNMELVGSLQHLSDHKQLEFLILSQTHVTGGLEMLSGMSGVTSLQLDGTSVGGSLGGLSAMLGMLYLRLENTRVTGSLDSLSKMPELVELSLENLNVSGSLGALRDMEAILHLDLSATRVGGNLEELKAMQKLSQLDLSDTQITGNLSSLQVASLLSDLDLSGNAGVTGDIGFLTSMSMKNLQHVKLANTKVTGRLTKEWRGKLRGLLSLDLSGSGAEFLPIGDDLQNLADAAPLEHLEDGVLLLHLVQLDVSRCPLHGNVEDLIRPLANCKGLAKILAPEANLTGSLPDLTGENVGKALQVLDLSRNQLERIDGLNAGSLLSLAGNPAIDFGRGLLQKAEKQGVRLDLTGVDFSNGRQEAEELMQQGVITKTQRPAMVDADNGYSCFDLTDAFLQVTPALFLPDALCGCLPGWAGNGIYCRPCGHGFYSTSFNSTGCTQCPPGSNTTEKHSSSLQSCQCKTGRIYNTSCECEPHSALDERNCVDCNELNLDCPLPGSLVQTARPMPGHARLAPEAPNASRCLDLAEERCNASALDSSELGCTVGYDGPLCTTCADGYRSSGSRCERCAEGSEAKRWPATAGFGVLVVAAGLVFAWRSRSAEASPAAARAPTPRDALGPLLLAQAPILLQLAQLWGVLAALGATTHQSQGDGPGKFDMWEEEYVEWLQFTASAVRDALSLECAYGRTARTMSALAAPCLPLLVLALCFLVEAAARGRGVSLALKALSLLFAGGASSCAKLLQCQRLDGGGNPLHDFAFRAQLPHKLCSSSEGEAGWADVIGRFCAVSYLILIPAFLMYLMVKQHLVLSPSRRCVACTDAEGERTLVRVVTLRQQAGLPTRNGHKDQKHVQQLAASVAAGVAYSAVFLSGTVRLTWENGTLAVQRVGHTGHENEVELDANSIVSGVLETKDDADLQRWQAITRMLTERSILEEAEGSDRVLAGAKELFFKYVACQEVWIEVALKIVVVALVAVAATYQNLQLTLGLTMGSAVVFGTLKPYRQRQVNDLQSFCFLCLSAAAVGFAWSWPWLARGALAAPLALAGAQALRPDGPEALALRLFEAARSQWPELERGEPVELKVETLSFL